MSKDNPEVNDLFCDKQGNIANVYAVIYNDIFYLRKYDSLNIRSWTSPKERFLSENTYIGKALNPISTAFEVK